MIKIIFGKSSSQNYSQALNKAKRTSTSFSQIGEEKATVNTASYPFSDIEKAMSLWEIVSSWKSSEFLFDDKQLSNSDIPLLELINRCHSKRSVALLPDEYCEDINDYEPFFFVCRQLTSILKKSNKNSLEYYIYDDYYPANVWYQIGKLNDDRSVFIVDKDRILKILIAESEKKKLFACPHFSIDQLKAQIGKLPENIIFNDTTEFVLDESDTSKPVIRTKLEFEKITQKKKEEEELKHQLEIEKKENEKGDYYVGNSDINVSYSDLGGLDKEVQLVRECIELPIQSPEIYNHLGIQPFRGILLYGPPGTGKTLLAKAVASQCKMNFYSVSGPEFFDKYVGESERKLREIFQNAIANQPSIIFFDEIDAIASKRVDSGSEQVYNKIVTQFLALLDGIGSTNKVVVIAATNRPNSLDPAIRRPGRLDYEIYIAPPDEKGRFDILKIHSKLMPLDFDVDLQQLASTLYGYVGADLMALCKEAGLTAFRRFIYQEHSDNDYRNIKVSMNDFILAKTKTQPSAGREVIALEPKINWEDVIGLVHAKSEIEKKIINPWFLKDKYPRIRRIKGLLLYGPPGVGKTYLSKALARRMRMNIIALKGSDILSKFAGESSSRISEFFRKAKELSPCILVIDEIDAIAPSRNENKADGDSVNELLSQMDGFDDLTNVLVIGTTNRKDIIDSALMRPGRFDLQIEIGYPPKEEIISMMSYYLQKSGFPYDVTILQTVTHYQSGAEVENAVNQAIYEAIWNNDSRLLVKHFGT